MRGDVMVVLIGLALTAGLGCQPEPGPAVEGRAVLMTVGSQELREDEFRRAYRVFRASYGAEADETPADERAAMIRFLQQLSDQLVLMERARAGGLVVADDALHQAVEEIRADYPEGQFDQMLLENAVNFEDWKEALRVRLSIEKLIEAELGGTIRITEEDIAAHYAAHPEDLPTPGAEDAGDKVDQLLVQQLRRMKTEQAFGPWLEDLRTRYAVAIDQAVLQKIMADSGLLADERAPKVAK